MHQELEDSFLLAGTRINDEDLPGLIMAVLVDNADGILILDADGTIVAANPAAEQLFGRSAAQLVGTPLGHPVSSGVRLELELLSVDGVRYAELLSRTTTWQGEPARVVALRDVTHRRRAINALNDYVSMTAHEVANPLQSITGFAETLLTSWDQIDDERRHQFIEIIHRQASRVSSISQDLLALSRMDAASVDLHPEHVLVRDVLEDLLLEDRAGGMQVELEVDPDLTVFCDHHQYATIVGNLLSNAGKYGAPPIVVRARGARDHVGSNGDGRQMVELSVADHGEGVPRDFVPQLFERFARAKQGTAKGKDGTGLGLSLSRGMAELNKGHLDYRRNQPTGSVFTLTMPAEP